ncbi:hypothetical protein MKX01_036590, partial [Papaver californicum]
DSQVDEQADSLLGKRTFVNFLHQGNSQVPVEPTSSGILWDVVSGCTSRPDFNFEKANAHFSFSTEEISEKEEFHTPSKNLNQIVFQKGSFHIPFEESPDPIEESSSLGSNSIKLGEVDEAVLNLDEYGSFLKMGEEQSSKYVKIPEKVSSIFGSAIAAENETDGNEKGIQ